MAEDELDPLVTECPSCSTRFRVNETQLEIAGGRVRCGACLTVFDGTERLLFASGEPQPEQPEAALDELLDELHTAAEDDSVRAVEVDDVGDRSADEVSVDGPLEDEVSADEPTDFADEDVFEDELVGDQPIEDESTGDGAEVDGAYPTEGPVEQDEEQANLGVDVDLPETGDEGIWGAFSDADDARVDPVPEVDVDASENAEDASENAEDANANAEEVAETPEESSVGREVVMAGLPENEIWAVKQPSAEVKLRPYLGDLEAEPKPPKRWWVGLIMVVAILGLIAQVLWYQSDNWSRDPDMRPYYEQVCEWLGCELPVIRAPQQIQPSNLVVRSHPDVPGALVVDALVINNASFPQPFPVVELTFTTVDGNLVAGRRFRPDEYLGGDLEGATMLPSKTPVHITLEIEDPGPDAVNYFMKFR
ncbi:MAG: zinc-ribbon domain-containing protein [Gammaproteobacteria bacterium]|nr:zinc-ribbon domain-containing protein [Gammaproteobacteria bacterium]